jgi:hypothetical protein
VDECVLVIGKVATLQGIKHIIELHKVSAVKAWAQN